MIKDTKIGVKGMEVWKKSPLFHGMTEQKIEEILMQEQCRRKKYEKGTFVFLEGDVPKSLFLLIIIGSHFTDRIDLIYNCGCSLQIRNQVS